MRWPLAALLFSLTSPCPPAAIAAEPTFPYKAYVTADDAYVRSGPGDNYYPTDKLKAGQEVEVYRHDPGGWYAIRPPAGSFSWVAARQLVLERDNLATVAEERAPAAVGSRFSNVRDVIQVRLHRGEAIEVLDAPAAGQATVPLNTWYKVAPPAGEFRWVLGKAVSAELPHQTATKAASGDDARGKNAGGPLAEKKLAPATRLTPEQFQAELSDIDIELSTTVVEEPGVWDLRELHARAQTLLDQAETPVDRGRSRTLVTKITRFEDIKERHVALNAARAEASRADGPPLPASPDPAAAPSEGDGRYDAVGRLARVPSAKLGTPQYALLDGKGNVLCYVSPAPGVNLGHYLGRQVGLNGTRGFMPEQRATHVMAKHVNVLDAGGAGTTLR